MVLKAKIIYFVIILLSQTVVRIISRQPFFFIIRYSFPIDLTFLGNRKTPETQGFWGILRLDTTLSYDNKSIFRLYYSMIVATRPDPTVRPPSRTLRLQYLVINGCFLWLYCLDYIIFGRKSVVSKNFVAKM